MKYAFLVLTSILSVSMNSTVHAAACRQIVEKEQSKALLLSSQVLNNQRLPFIEHVGPSDDPYGTALAMNVQFAPIHSLKDQIESSLKRKTPLNTFTGWNKNGEAHITTVTPVEYHFKLRAFVTPARMNTIARDLKIQGSDLEILGLGRGTATLAEKKEDTYFVIVRSENLLKIRRAIYQEYLKNGGSPKEWDPEHFYPHITIAYTGSRDLHEQDGVYKDVENSLDKRFHIELR